MDVGQSVLCTSCSIGKENMQQLERQHSNQVFPFINIEKESITSSSSDKNVNAGTPPNPTPCLQTSVMLILCQTEQTEPHPSLQFLLSVLMHHLLLSEITTTSNYSLSPMLNLMGCFSNQYIFSWLLPLYSSRCSGL